MSSRGPAPEKDGEAQGATAGLILAAQLQALQGRLPVAQLTVLVNATVVAAVLSGPTTRIQFGIWLGAAYAVVALRLVTLARQERGDPTRRPRLWSFHFFAGAFLSGANWGVLALFFDRLAVPERLFALTVIAGMVAGAASSMAGSPAAFLAYSLPALGPTLARFLLGSSRLEVATGAMGCLFAGAMWTLFRTDSRTLRASLVLRFRNEALIEELSAAQERLTAANAGLAERVREGSARLVEAERKLAGSALLASIGSLAASVAHDINSPLASLMGNLGVVERELGNGAPAVGDAEAAREALADAHTCAARVRDIVRSLGELARADRTPGPIDVREVLDSCLAVATPELRNRVTLVRDFGELPLVRGDRAGLSQTFLGLLLHMGRALPLGAADPPELRLRAHADPEKGEVRVELFCASPSRRPGPADAGEGASGTDASLLPLSQAIVARAGGRIVAREDGQGGFAVTLPVDGAG